MKSSFIRPGRIKSALNYRTNFCFTACLVFILLLCMPWQASADDIEQPAKNEAFKHSLGIGAGFTTGVGLSYRYLPEKFGFQTNFAPLRVDENETIISLGFTFIYRLIEAERSNFYLYQGNHFLYEKWDGYYYRYMYDGYTDRSFYNGIGMGLELIVLNSIGFNIMFGYAAHENFSRLGLTGETAIYYKF